MVVAGLSLKYIVMFLSYRLLQFLQIVGLVGPQILLMLGDSPRAREFTRSWEDIQHHSKQIEILSTKIRL